MGKFFKILGIIIAGLALLVVLAVTIIPMVLPWGSMLTGALEEKLGRPATVEDVSVSLWGGLEAEVKGLVVKDKPAYGERPLVSLDTLTVRADLLPLLASSLVVRQVRVDRLELSMVRGKDGRLNWRDLPVGKKEEREHHEREDDDDDGHLIVSSLQVTGSKIFLKNLANGMSSELPLERFNLSSDLTTGGAGGQVSLAMPGLSLESAGQSKGYGDDFVLEQGKLGLKLDLAALAQRLAPLYPGLKARGTVEISGQAQGPSKALKVQAQGRARNLRLQTTAMGKRYFSLPEATLMADLTLDLLGDLARIGQAQLSAPGAGLVQTMSGTLGWGESLGKSDARFEQRLDLGKLAELISPLMPWPIKASGLASKQVRFKGTGPGVLEISGENRGQNIYFSCPAMAAPFKDPSMRAVYRFLVKDKDDEFEIKQFDLDTAVAKLGITGKMAKKDRKVKIRLAVKGSYLNLDRLPLGPPPDGQKAPARRAKAATAPGKTVATGQAKAGGMGSGGGKGGPNPAQIRRNLAGLDAEAEVELGLVRARGYELKDLELEAKVKDAKAELEELKAGFLGGKVKMSAGVDFNPASPVSKLELKGDGLKITPRVFRKLKQDLPLFALPLSGLTGVFSLDSEMKGEGLTAEALAASLKGKGSLKARDEVTIELAFLDHAEGVAALWQQALGNLPRRFTKFEGKYKIGGGRVNYDIDLKAGDNEVDAMIVGSTGLLDGSLDATLKFDAETVGHTLREVLAPDGTFPIKLGGTVDHPVPTLALGGAPAEKAVEGLIKGLFNR
ncbi:MAG: AsmA family protein [Desulfarculaceae bacterium]|nr:AsmA family protein [Desulfarculaceae bacterium]MCF8071603.1 AsmA family protein [Desulfarculaceae bacterium]MCF8103200.1 AsmA family protein [Desulfarculaceae bacterium]MCF8114882.1 AsmA family protein [Desulfarculaceae bacterium]